jgi:nitroreductase
MKTFIENQNWRYATKKFDASKKISEQEFEILKEAIRLSSSSYGLQPYKIIIVENPEKRELIRQAAWGQSQVVDASHLIVFANKTKLEESDINEYFDNASQTRNVDPETFAGYAGFMKSKVLTLSPENTAVWTSKQTYLALANLLNAAAELKIDATPMEGFDPAVVNKILGLDALGLHASLLAPVGYRHTEDDTQHLKKVRKQTNELFFTI